MKKFYKALAKGTENTRTDFLGNKYFVQLLITDFDFVPPLAGQDSAQRECSQ